MQGCKWSMPASRLQKLPEGAETSFDYPTKRWMKKIISSKVQKHITDIISLLDFSFLGEYVQGGFAGRLVHKVNKRQL